MPFLRILRVVAVLAAVPVSLSFAATSAEAQDPRCVAPDTIIVSGNRRVDDLTVLEDAAIRSGDAISARTIQAALKNLYSSGQYEDVRS